MKILIDIGNSSIVIGLFTNNFVQHFSIRADREKTASEYAALIKDLIKVKEKVNGGIISSVVPALTPIVKKAIQEIYDVDILVLGVGLKTGLSIRTDSQGEVGADLIASAVKVINDYPLPSLIIDCGTATTISYIDNGKSLAGVIIAPGIHTSATAICKKAALLPEIKLEAPRDILGRNSHDALKSGIVLGHALMLDGFIERICKQYGTVNTIVITGGLAEVVAPLLQHHAILVPNLLLEGLKLILDKNEK